MICRSLWLYAVSVPGPDGTSLLMRSDDTHAPAVWLRREDAEEAARATGLALAEVHAAGPIMLPRMPGREEA